jgi:hypothetical protein
MLSLLRATHSLSRGLARPKIVASRFISVSPKQVNLFIPSSLCRHEKLALSALNAPLGLGVNNVSMIKHQQQWHIQLRFQHTERHKLSSDFDPTLMLMWRLFVGLVFLAIILGYLTDTRAAFYRYIALPLVHKLVDPEDAHGWAVWAASLGLVPWEKNFYDDVRLHVKVLSPFRL